MIDCGRAGEVDRCKVLVVGTRKGLVMISVRVKNE
jgi:hypothetical protein